MVLCFHLAKVEIILGLPWIRQVNPKINLEEGTVDIDKQRINRTYTEDYKNVVDVKQIVVNQRTG